MITNFETNKVYLSRGICESIFLDGAKSIIDRLHHERIEWAFVPFTDSYLHIWARDFMPVQVTKNKFVKFKYDPDYLKDAPEYKPDTDAIMDSLNLQIVCSDINLDGGNIISCGDKVILTDKIFLENPLYTKTGLIGKLQELLEAEPVIIPWDRYEEYGHADGMVRYIAEGKVLLNNYFDFDKSLRQKLLKTLSPYFDVEELHYGSYTRNSWAYLNFLHVGNTILIPFMNDKLQDKAYEQIKGAFPDCCVFAVPRYESIIREGGALNCTTWNICSKIITQEPPSMPSSY